MVRATVCLAMALYMAGCAGDTGVAQNNSDVAVNDVRVPPGADSPYPPEDTNTQVEPDIEPPKPDVPTDPCAEYDWIQAGKVYQCTYTCGGAGPCTPVFTNENGECGVNCDPNFYELARDLGRDGQNIIEQDETCPATCVPFQ